MASRPSPLQQRPTDDGPTEAAQIMAPPKPKRRRSDRPRFTYRIDPSVHRELHRIKTEVEASGDFATTIDQIAEDLILAGVEAYDAGHCEISGQDLKPKTRRKA